jgi:hypothetical protein
MAIPGRPEKNETAGNDPFTPRKTCKRQRRSRSAAACHPFIHSPAHRAAANLLAEFGTPEQIPALQARVDAEDKDFREAAKSAIAARCPQP